MSYESLSVLRQKYCCPMIFGVAMDSNKLNNVNFKKIIPYVFDSITCENDMKPNYMSGDTEALPYNYTKADATVSFAKNYNMKIVGHVLWYDPANNPKFVTASVRPTGMSNIVENHIRNVITHFDTIAPNMVYAWQVTNEALSDDGTIQTDQLIQQNIKDSEKLNIHLNCINRSTQNMDHHINFVENVFDVVKYPFSSLLSLYYGFKKHEIKDILDIHYTSKKTLNITKN